MSTTNEPILIELPRYQCHKKVSALKIANVVPSPRGMLIGFDDQRYAPHEVSEDWYYKHDPEVGGYFVVYEDGYQSYSPAAAFEGGYKPDQPEDARVSPDMITRAIVGAQYHVFPGTTVTVCLIELANGAKVIGHNYGAIDPARQDWEQGKQDAYGMAREKIWELEGYALRDRLSK